MTGLIRRGLAVRAPGLLGPEVACVAMADWLFWGHAPGLSVPLFWCVVAVTAWIFRLRRGSRARGILAVAVLVTALAPAVDRLSPLSFAFALLGTALSIQIRAGRPAAPCRHAAPWSDAFRASVLLAFSGPVQIVRDLRRRRALRRRRSEAAEAAATARRWRAWVVPAILFAAFLTLLAIANPLIASLLLDVVPDWSDLLPGVPRALFWLVVLAAVWPCIRLRRRHRRPRPAAPPLLVPSLTEDPPAWDWDRLAAVFLSRDALLRAFLALDVLLALQIGLDGAYLWGGIALPQGVTYAGYAHRGAYPLVLTALLAATLVLVIRRPGGPSRSRAVSALLAVFLVENVLLVVSAIARLDLYVDTYGLTVLRVAAFAWMVLVLVGLLLIGLQGALGRGNGWLLARCLPSGLALLYGWCFADVPGIVAAYDVAHCREMRGEGPALDAGTIQDLGASAIPAVDRFMLAAPDARQRDDFTAWRAGQTAEVRRAMADWRSWSVEDWRLSRYLDRSKIDEPALPTPAAAGDG